jgi:hypothetical protein
MQGNSFSMCLTVVWWQWDLRGIRTVKPIAFAGNDW